MLGTPFLIIATLCVQIYIIAAIFFLTYRIVTPRLTQIPTNLKHHDYITKRGAFILYIGFFEMIFVLIVQVELSRHIPLIAQPVEKQCSEMRGDGAITFVSYGILACILLSVVRCLVQSYVLERLSMPDVVSMTRVYLLPSTYFVGLLCVRLWLNVDVEPERSNRIACYQKLNWPGVKNSPVNFFLFMLTFMITNIIYEFAVLGCERESSRLQAYGHISSDLRRQRRSDTMQASTVTKYVAFGQQSIGLQNTLINANEKASHSSLLNTKDSTIHVPTMDADPNNTTTVVKVEPSYSKSVKLWRTVFPGDIKSFKVKAPRGSFRKFLSRSIRLYFALIVYFVIFVGCYQCTEYLLLGSFLEDFTPIVFASIVIINGVLRFVQIAHAWTITTDEKSHDVVVCENQSVAALVEV